jgi:hypothetical protein
MNGKGNENAFGTLFGVAWTKTLVVIATCWVLSAIVLVLAVVGMRCATGLPRLVPMSGLESPNAYDARLTIESDRDRFRHELAPVVTNSDEAEAKVLAILEWVMNQIPKVENRYAKSSWEMIEIGRAGGGLICAGMAQVFTDALLANGIPARRVFLLRNMNDNLDTHVTVEAWVDGKWRIYDPTFHISFKRNGTTVGVYEARDWFIKQKGQYIAVQFLGDVHYPARIDAYPIRYVALFNNVFIAIPHSYSRAYDIPIFGGYIAKASGIWFGPDWGYPIKDDGLSMKATDFYRFLYYATLCVLPTINMVLLLAMWLIWRKAKRTRR